jgi:hypothetical protein
MPMPFPGMDPYLEHPVIWPDVHVQLIVALASQLRPRIKPRYAVTLEERVFIENPSQQPRVPDAVIKKARTEGRGPMPAVGMATATPLVVEVPELEIREPYIAIRDRYHGLGVVTVIELVSPSNKAAGPGRDSYLAKRRGFRDSECHLVEIDLLRRGRHVMSVPKPLTASANPFDYMVCVNRWPTRNRFELYPCRLRDPLPTIGIPLADPDPDAPLAIQAGLEYVYDDADYALNIRYDKPCKPRLSPEDQEWASECWATYRRAHPDLFPEDNGG